MQRQQRTVFVARSRTHGLELSGGDPTLCFLRSLPVVAGGCTETECVNPLVAGQAGGRLGEGVIRRLGVSD